MADYINRDDAIKAMLTRYWDGKETLREIMNSVPAADVAPIHNAEWNKNNDAIVCSLCGFGMFPIFVWSKNGKHSRDTFYPRFCPDCGARMDEEDT